MSVHEYQFGFLLLDCVLCTYFFIIKKSLLYIWVYFKRHNHPYCKVHEEMESSSQESDCLALFSFNSLGIFRGGEAYELIISDWVIHFDQVGGTLLNNAKGTRKLLLDEDLKGLSKTGRLGDMIEYLSKVRTTHISELKERYGVSRSTVKNDLNDLEIDFGVRFDNIPGVCIRVEDGWWFGRKPLTDIQKRAIRKAIELLDEDELKNALIVLL